jgi:hypothetical protein
MTSKNQCAPLLSGTVRHQTEVAAFVYKWHMAAGKLQSFFGDDWEDTWDAVISAPGALGNVVVGAARQVRLVDFVCLALMAAGIVWLIYGYLIQGDHRIGLALLALLPIAVWLVAGFIGGWLFVVGSIGLKALRYWESYLFIAMFVTFGTVSMRLAISPRDGRIHRPTPTA